MSSNQTKLSSKNLEHWDPETILFGEQKFEIVGVVVRDDGRSSKGE